MKRGMWKKVLKRREMRRTSPFSFWVFLLPQRKSRRLGKEKGIGKRGQGKREENTKEEKERHENGEEKKKSKF
jgi:hypothetical protein